jgi:RP/EB family microtubule-associated protein
MDALHPDVISMSKVDWNLKNEYEFVRNYKELQKAFTAVGIEKVGALLIGWGPRHRWAQ